MEVCLCFLEIIFWKESRPEKGAKSTQFKVITFILFKCQRSINNSVNFYLCCCKKLMIAKNLIAKIQNLVMNHESHRLLIYIESCI